MAILLFILVMPVNYNNDHERDLLALFYNNPRKVPFLFVLIDEYEEFDFF